MNYKVTHSDGTFDTTDATSSQEALDKIYAKSGEEPISAVPNIQPPSPEEQQVMGTMKAIFPNVANGQSALQTTANIMWNGATAPLRAGLAGLVNVGTNAVNTLTGKPDVPQDQQYANIINHMEHGYTNPIGNLAASVVTDPLTYFAPESKIPEAIPILKTAIEKSPIIGRALAGALGGSFNGTNPTLPAEGQQPTNSITNPIIGGVAGGGVGMLSGLLSKIGGKELESITPKGMTPEDLISNDVERSPLGYNNDVDVDEPKINGLGVTDITRSHILTKVDDALNRSLGNAEFSLAPIASSPEGKFNLNDIKGVVKQDVTGKLSTPLQQDDLKDAIHYANTKINSLSDYSPHLTNNKIDINGVLQAKQDLSSMIENEINPNYKSVLESIDNALQTNVDNALAKPLTNVGEEQGFGDVAPFIAKESLKQINQLNQIKKGLNKPTPPFSFDLGNHLTSAILGGGLGSTHGLIGGLIGGGLGGALPTGVQKVATNYPGIPANILRAGSVLSSTQDNTAIPSIMRSVLTKLGQGQQTNQ